MDSHNSLILNGSRIAFETQKRQLLETYSKLEKEVTELEQRVQKAARAREPFIQPKTNPVPTPPVILGQPFDFSNPMQRYADYLTSLPALQPQQMTQFTQELADFFLKDIQQLLSIHLDVREFEEGVFYSPTFTEKLTKASFEGRLTTLKKISDAVRTKVTTESTKYFNLINFCSRFLTAVYFREVHIVRKQANSAYSENILVFREVAGQTQKYLIQDAVLSYLFKVALTDSKGFPIQRTNFGALYNHDQPYLYAISTKMGFQFFAPASLNTIDTAPRQELDFNDISTPFGIYLEASFLHRYEYSTYSFEHIRYCFYLENLLVQFLRGTLPIEHLKQECLPESMMQKLPEVNNFQHLKNIVNLLCTKFDNYTVESQVWLLSIFLVSALEVQKPSDFTFLLQLAQGKKMTLLTTEEVNHLGPHNLTQSITESTFKKMFNSIITVRLNNGVPTFPSLVLILKERFKV